KLRDETPSSTAIVALECAIPVTLRIRSGRIRSCREGARGSRIAKQFEPDRRGWVPGDGVDVITVRRRRPVCWCGCGGPKLLQHMLDRILGQFDSAAVLVT